MGGFVAKHPRPEKPICKHKYRSELLDTAALCGHLVAAESVYAFVAQHRSSCSRMSCSPIRSAR